jgi:biopolymer transport protein ExbB
MKNLTTILLFATTTSLLTGQYSGQGVSPEASVDDALQRLAAVREEIAAEKIPLSKELNTLEASVLELRREAERQQRLRDSGGMDLNALEADLKARQEEVDYISSLVTEFLSALETRADPSELAVMRSDLDRALSAIDNPSLEIGEQFMRQMEGIELGLDRLASLSGGRTLAGSAIAESGDLVEGTFALYGPTTFFSSGEQVNGIAVRGDTDAPVVVPASGFGSMIASTLSSGSGTLPLDPTLGKAIAIASTDETLIEHILKGGIWIYPILFAAALSLAIALFKFMEIFGIKQIPASKIREIVKHIKEGRQKEAKEAAEALSSPGSELLLAGVENADEPKELLEEILLEKIVETQPRIERLLPIIAVTAATAPLLGLLGTVTGMINTFKLITLFGTGDAKSLSSGISEALITTEFGLIVAIPSLILHAILSRKAKAIMSGLEANAMSFVNGISARGKSREAA